MKTMLSLSDDRIRHLINERRDLYKIRQLIKDSIHMVEVGNVLVGLDITDLEELFKVYKELYIGMVNSKEASNSVELVEKLIASTEKDVSSCCRVYLYFEGDISLMDVNDVATSLEEKMGDKVDIVFTATYNEVSPDEYDVMASFFI